MAQFVGIVHKDKTSDYGVCFPDFPGCITAGETMQEAYEMAKEALYGHITTMIDYGDTLPTKPLSLDQAARHEFARKALSFFMVEVPLLGKSKRINITMDADLIASIDNIAANRSAFLEAAAREKLMNL